MEKASTLNTTMQEEERTSSREERFNKLRRAPKSPTPSSKPKIQRVPFMLRDNEKFEKYYEPRAVAIGPFHHGKPRCKLAQEFKLILTKRFVEESGQTDEDLYKKIEENINEHRNCYDEEATKCYDDETLAWMLFLDGCSTLQFIYSFMYEDLEKLFKIKRDQIAFAQQDLFLLENQVPYQVLKLLMSSSEKSTVLKKSIEDFVQLHIMAKQKDPERHKQKQQPGDHLAISTEEDPEPTHLLELLRTRMLGPLPKSDVPNNKVRDFPGQSFRNVQELNAAGIYFRPSKSSFLRDISFTSHWYAGFLSLPPISVDDSMGPKFLNLIAYEMCPDFHNDFGVTSYICFLDALIDHADDVKKLRSARILDNLLGSDNEVAQLFNEIGTDLVPNTEIYRNVKANIEKHYKTKWKTWLTQFYHNHFSSPWTFLAFMGVTAALWLSGIQTWYTVHSPPSPCRALCQYFESQLHIK